MGVDVRLRLLDDQEVGDRPMRPLILKFEQFERQKDQVCPAKTQLVNGTLIVLV